MANRERWNTDWAFPSNPFAELLRRQAELTLVAQEEALKDLSAAVDGWIGRRQEATEAALVYMKQIAQTQDAGEASQVMTEWAQRSLERLTDDARDQMELGLRLANRLASVENGETASAAPAPARPRTAPAAQKASPRAEPRNGAAGPQQATA